MWKVTGSNLLCITYAGVKCIGCCQGSCTECGEVYAVFADTLHDAEVALLEVLNGHMENCGKLYEL